MADENLELLNLDDELDIEEIGGEDPFATTVRPKRPWLLLGIGAVVIALASFIIVRAVINSGDSSETIVLDAPADSVETVEIVSVETNEPVSIEIKPAPVPTAQVPAPVIEQPVKNVPERKEVVFNPDAKTTTEPVKPVVKPKPTKPAPASVKAGSYYVQFGSYSSREAANAGQAKIQKSHQSLFNGREFVILAAKLPNGSTTYRLRVPFAVSADASGFCNNAKADGLDCYVAR